ncbi:MAG: hypothetical protein PUB93_08475 [Firmicutes bacterium]|nr:hypothetical protein [Bacillota bacterium]
MKVSIRSRERSLHIAVPTRMLFSKSFLKFGLKMGKKYSDQVPDIPPEAVDTLCDEIRRIKRKRGSWLLADIQSADGENIRVIL